MVNNQISVWSSAQNSYPREHNKQLHQEKKNKYSKYLSVRLLHQAMIQQICLIRGEYNNHPLLSYRRQIFKYFNIFR